MLQYIEIRMVTFERALFRAQFDQVTNKNSDHNNMKNEELNNLFKEKLSTPLITDACIRNSVPLRLAPFGIHPIVPEWKIAGAAVGVKHFGSVDLFIERIHTAKSGDILVIDNEGRTDEGCIGDLTVLEAASTKMNGIMVWGVHRDTTEIKRIDLPVFSFGAYPLGPVRKGTKAGGTNKTR
jgi:4-hydroxy-4-methyl-2-oxoglutarate aldolase